MNNEKAKKEFQKIYGRHLGSTQGQRDVWTFIDTAINKAVAAEREKILPIKKAAIGNKYLNRLKNLEGNFIDDFGTFDYEGYGKAILEEINYLLSFPSELKSLKDK